LENTFGNVWDAVLKLRQDSLIVESERVERLARRDFERMEGN